MQLSKSAAIYSVIALLSIPLVACGGSDDEDEETGIVSIHNDFDNPEFSRMPPWTICEACYGGAEFETVLIGETSAEQEVRAGLDYVLMVAAWDDPSCSPENALPIASRNEEEVVAGQTRTISINVPNHQGPCPPEGVEPIPQELYDRILDRWPGYGFTPYADRTENTQCLE